MTAEAHLTDTLTLKSISAWRKDTSYTPIDFDSRPVVDVDVPAVYRNEQTSQEFQLLYDRDRLHGIFGYYYLGATAQRSEEHTSELQSLMRISYAGFCLKNKKIQRYKHNIIRTHNTKLNNYKYTKRV